MAAGDMVLVTNYTLTVNGTSVELVSGPIFFGTAADLINRSAWGQTQRQYIGGESYYLPVTFTCRLGVGECAPDFPVRCVTTLVQTITLSNGKCGTEEITSTCSETALGIISAVTPSNVGPSDDPTYTITFQPNSVT